MRLGGWLDPPSTVVGLQPLNPGIGLPRASAGFSRSFLEPGSLSYLINYCSIIHKITNQLAYFWWPREHIHWSTQNPVVDYHFHPFPPLKYVKMAVNSNMNCQFLDGSKPMKTNLGESPSINPALSSFLRLPLPGFWLKMKGDLWLMHASEPNSDARPIGKAVALANMGICGTGESLHESAHPTNISENPSPDHVFGHKKRLVYTIFFGISRDDFQQY